MSRDQFSRQSGRGYGTVQDENHDQSAARTSYSDSYMNFDEICEEISKDIYLINNGGNKLEKSMQLIGTDRDSISLRDRIHETSVKTAKIVEKTSSMIKKAVPSRQSDKMRKVQLDRLTTQFYESVQRFRKLQKSATEKVRMTGEVPEKSPPSDFLGDYDDWSGLMQEERRREQLQEQEQRIESDLELIREREDRIRQLESDILDVNVIFRELGTLIHEQGSTIDLIESNVESAYTQVEGGAAQLSKAVDYQKKARKKLCILLVILLVIALIITIVVVTQVKG